MVSIIVPIYGVEKYISGCIHSILGQSVKDFELILIDDGTPDQSAEIAEKILKESDFEKYRIIHTENKGVSSARNTGVQVATGEFVIMVDADDVLAPCFLADMLRCVNEHPECNIYSSGFSVVTEGQTDSLHFEKEMVPCVYTAKKAISLFQSRTVKFLLPTLMLRLSFLKKYSIQFDETVRYSEDVQYIWRCLFYNTAPVVHLDKANYSYILHGNSTMTASNVVKILTGFNGLQRLSEEFEDLLDHSRLDTIISQMYFSLLHGAAKMLRFQDFKNLYHRGNCREHLLTVKDGDYRYKCVTRILKINLFCGYQVLRKF